MREVIVQQRSKLENRWINKVALDSMHEGKKTIERKVAEYICMAGEPGMHGQPLRQGDGLPYLIDVTEWLQSPNSLINCYSTQEQLDISEYIASLQILTE